MLHSTSSEKINLRHLEVPLCLPPHSQILCEGFWRRSPSLRSTQVPTLRHSSNSWSRALTQDPIPFLYCHLLGLCEGVRQKEPAASRTLPSHTLPSVLGLLAYSFESKEYQRLSRYPLKREKLKVQGGEKNTEK